MRVNSKALELIKCYSGVDAGGYNLDILKSMSELEDRMRGLIKVDLNDDQWSALFSLVHDIGILHFEGSHLLKFVNSGEFDKAANEFKVYSYRSFNGHNQPSRIIAQRRQREAAMFRGEGVY